MADKDREWWARYEPAMGALTCYEGAVYACAALGLPVVDDVTGLPAGLTQLPDSACTFLGLKPLDISLFPQDLWEEYSHFYFQTEGLALGGLFTPPMANTEGDNTTPGDASTTYMRCEFGIERELSRPLVVTSAGRASWLATAMYDASEYGWDHIIAGPASSEGLWNYIYNGQLCQKADRYGVYDVVLENNWLQLTTMQAEWDADAAAAANVARFDAIVPSATYFGELFPNAHRYYTYEGLR